MTPAEIVDDVLHRMLGCNGSKVATLYDVANIAAKCDGDHLEIGSFYGASAIVAALAKIKSGKTGMIYCVDPYGYDRQEPVTIQNLKLTPATAANMASKFRANLDLFGVRDRVILIQKPSYPWPSELDGLRFDSVLIDGWHYDETPLQDAQNAVRVANKYIVLDDVISRYPGIIAAYNFILETGEWVEIYRSKHAVTFQKK